MGSLCLGGGDKTKHSDSRLGLQSAIPGCPPWPIWTTLAPARPNSHAIGPEMVSIAKRKGRKAAHSSWGSEIGGVRSKYRRGDLAGLPASGSPDRCTAGRLRQLQLQLSASLDVKMNRRAPHCDRSGLPRSPKQESEQSLVARPGNTRGEAFASRLMHLGAQGPDPASSTQGSRYRLEALPVNPKHLPAPPFT